VKIGESAWICELWQSLVILLMHFITPACNLLNTNPQRKRGRLSRDIKLCRK